MRIKICVHYIILWIIGWCYLSSIPETKARLSSSSIVPTSLYAVMYDQQQSFSLYRQLCCELWCHRSFGLFLALQFISTNTDSTSTVGVQSWKRGEVLYLIFICFFLKSKQRTWSRQCLEISFHSYVLIVLKKVKCCRKKKEKHVSKDN